MDRPQRPQTRSGPAGGAKSSSAASRPAAPDVGPLLSAGFALMALVPILLSLFLLEQGAGGLAGLPGAVVILMIVSAGAGFLLIRRELARAVVQILRVASREASAGFSDTLREASEDEIGRITTTIREITSELSGSRAPEGKRSWDRLDEGIARVAHAVQAAAGTEDLRAMLVEGGLECLRGRAAYFVGIDETRGDFVVLDAAGEESETAMRWRTPLGEGIPGRCAREGRAFHLDGNVPEGGPGFTKPTTTLVAAPVRLGETLLGVLVVEGRADDGAAFTADDATLLGGYATIAATTLGAWSARERLERSIDDILAGLAAQIEARDPYARGHAARVARYCDQMARALHLDADTRATLRRAALVHDLGKLNLPETLLKKEGAFTPEELELVRTHAAAGDKLLRSIPALAPLAPLVRHHHERCDGSGYPDKLKGDAIPLPTHVLIVANAFDIMTSDRSYRKAAKLTDALETLRSRAGEWYDRRVVQALLGLDRSALRATEDAAEGGSTVRGRATASVSVRE